MSTKSSLFRRITDHKLNGLNDALELLAVDGPGPGGANHHYLVNLPDTGSPGDSLNVHFQNGPIGEAGVNGISNEALVAIVIDRLRGFQCGRKEDGSFDESKRGTYACRENAVALTHFEEGLMWLQKRTRDRLARGVEGTSKV